MSAAHVRRKASFVLLNSKVALVFGAGGAIGGTVSRAFAAEGATVFMSGRNETSVEAVQREIAASGGDGRVARVDATDENAVESYVGDVVQTAGRVDVVINAIGVEPIQGIPLSDLPMADFVAPILAWTSAQLITARVVGRHMVGQRDGVVLTLSASPATLAIAGTGGFGVACAAVEGLSRTLAAELGPAGVRVICMRPHRVSGTFDAPDFPMPAAEFDSLLEGMTLLRRLPTLRDIGRTAAFLASDGTRAMTGTVVDLTCGMSVR